MENHVRTDMIPHQAHLLYIKLYCENKGGKNKSVIQAAKKSWASLSISKKKLFYETTYNRNVLKYGHSLSKSLPYLKEKFPTKCQNKGSNDHEIVLPCNNSSVRDDEHHIQDDNRTESHTNSEMILDIINETSLKENSGVHDKNVNRTTAFSLYGSPTKRNAGTLEDTEKEYNDNNTAAPLCASFTPATQRKTILDDIVDRDSDSDSNHDDNMQPTEQEIGNTSAPPICEPIPPAVKDGKELYNMIKSQDAPDFTQIDKREKRYYHSAVRTLKRQYITNYTLFLESLPKKDLFDHYIKTFY